VNCPTKGKRRCLRALDLAALWHPPPIEAGELGQISIVLIKGEIT